MLVEICKNCKTKLAISPEGLCNICDEDVLEKIVEQIKENKNERIN